MRFELNWKVRMILEIIELKDEGNNNWDNEIRIENDWNWINKWK